MKNILDWIEENKQQFEGQEPRTMDQAALVDDLEPGALKDELVKDFDPSQETYEEYLQRKSLERPFNMAEGGRIGLGGGGFVFKGIRALYKAKKGLQTGRIEKELMRKYRDEGMELIDAVTTANREAYEIVDNRKLDIVQDAMTKVDIRSDDYIRLMDEQIRLTDYELYKDIKRWDEYRPDLSAKVRARHDPYWAESNFGENYDEVLLSNQAKALKAQSDEIDRMYPADDPDVGPSFVGEAQTVKEIDEMNKANIAELFEGKKKHAVGGRVGFYKGRLVTQGKRKGQWVIYHVPPSVEPGRVKYFPDETAMNEWIESRPGRGRKDFGKHVTGGIHKGTVSKTNQERLEKLKEVIIDSNNQYKKNITAEKALIKAGWKDGWNSIGSKGNLRKFIGEELSKLTTNVEKIENYVNNVMLADEALMKDFKSPIGHIQKKFGVSEKITTQWKKQSQAFADNKALFAGLSKQLSFNKYAYYADGTPRLMSDYSFITQNKMPSSTGWFSSDPSTKSILDSAKRNYMQMKAAGKTPKVTFITDPSITAIQDWQFIDNETERLFSIDPSIDTVEFEGKTYKNNYLQHKDARKLYNKEFGNIYKIYDEDLAKYMDAMVIGKEGKPIKLDTLLREQAVKLTGKESFWERRMMDVDHNDLWDDPFGRKKDGLRLIDRRANQQAGLYKRLDKYKNNPTLLKQKLDEIGYNRKFNNIDELIKFYSDRATGATGAIKNFSNNFSKTIQDLSPQSVVQLAKKHDCDSFQQGTSPIFCLQKKFKQDPQGFLQRSAPIVADGKNANMLKWLKKGRLLAKGTGVLALWEAAFAPLIAAPMYAKGESGSRILNEVAYGVPFIGETEKEELKKYLGDDAYKLNRLMEMGGEEVATWDPSGEKYEYKPGELDFLYENLGPARTVSDAIKKSKADLARGPVYIPSQFNVERIEDKIKKTEQESQKIWNELGLMEGPAGKHYNWQKISDLYDQRDKGLLDLAMGKHKRRRERIESGVVADPNWYKNINQFMGGGMVGIRKPSAIPPERQGLRSIMINGKKS